jgi:drug/metabolite transporter (DMT)-like permease
MTRGNSVAAVGFLSVTVVLWGGAFRATAVGADHASSLTLSALRAGPAMLILLLVLPLARARLPSRRQWPAAAVTGLLMVTLATEALPLAVTRAGAGNTAVLVNTSPLFVAVATVLFLRRRLSWLAAAGLVVGFGGVLMITAPQLGGSVDPGNLALGMGLALVLSAGWALGLLIIKGVADRDPHLDMLGFTAAQYAVGAPILVIAALAANGGGGTDWTAADLWGAVAWLAIGTSAIASFTFLSALKRSSADRVAAWQFVVPVVAVLVEVVRGSAPGALVLGGMALALAGVTMVNVAPQPAAAEFTSGSEAPLTAGPFPGEAHSAAYGAGGRRNVRSRRSALHRPSLGSVAIDEGGTQI